jgi:His/Glu/Gln/Arg/opine family amino acid ABC transporter permease subunit
MAVRGSAFGPVEPTACDRWLWRAVVGGMLLAGVVLLRHERWDVVIASGPFLLKSLGVSWLLTLAAIGIGLPAGILLALLRTGGPTPVKQIAVGVIEVVRATPQLMVIFWVFFAVPALSGQKVPAWTAAIISLSLIAASYLAEVMRAGILSVPSIQIESGLATGMTRAQIMSSIVLPQALRNMVPALIATVIMLFKITSLIYVVGITDFFRAVILINNREFEPIALYTTLAVGYFVCCWLMSLCVRQLDPKYVLAH